jgi:hypothetical protein
MGMHASSASRDSLLKTQSLTAGFPFYYSAGIAATVPGGHPTQITPGIETINDSVSVEQFIQNRITNKVDYIKIIKESSIWFEQPQGPPSLSYDSIHAIIDYAHSKGLKAVVHIGSLEEMTTIAAFKPDGFVHMLDYKEDYPVPDSYYQSLAKCGAFVITTGGIALKPLEGVPSVIQNWISTNLLDIEQRAQIA